MDDLFDLYCFDLDGTLVETAPEILDAVNDTLTRFDLPGVTQEQVERWIGHGTSQLLVQALAHASGTSAAAVRESAGITLVETEFALFYRRRCGTRSRLYPHAMELLRSLRDQGRRVAVVTNKEGAFARLVLRAHAIDPLVERLIAGDTLQTRKPHPQGVQTCMAQFAVPPARTVMVGDSSIDIETARNAGVAAWAVSHGYNMGQPIERSHPDRVLHDLGELMGAVRS